MPRKSKAAVAVLQAAPEVAVLQAAPPEVVPDFQGWKVEFRLVDFGSLKALACLSIGPMEIRGFKVIDQGDGKPWISAPSREIIKSGKKEYYEIVRIMDEEFRREFHRWMLYQYAVAAKAK